MNHFKYVFGIIVLIISMHNFTTWHILTVCLFLISLFLIFNLKTLNNVDFVFYSIIIFILLLYSTLPYVIGGTLNQDYVMDYYRIISGVIIAIFFDAILKNKAMIKPLLQAVSFVLTVHLVFIIIQSVFIYAFNIHLDPLSYFGREQRIYGGAGTGLYRPSGFYNEPGTYFTCISILLFCRYFIYPKIDFIFIAVLSSFILTLSVQALVLTPFIFLATMKSDNFISKEKIYTLSFILIVLALYFVGPYIFMYTESRFSGDDLTMSVRFNALSYFGNLSFIEQFVGAGLAVNNCNCLMADTGLWFTTVSSFGVIGFGVLILLIYKSYGSLPLFVMTTVVLVGKSEIYYPLVWMFFTFLFYFVSNDTTLKARVVQ